jgi:hypothetical protein
MTVQELVTEWAQNRKYWEEKVNRFNPFADIIFSQLPLVCASLKEEMSKVCHEYKIEPPQIR